jgi:hypothetical protein
MPSTGNGNAARRSSKAANTHFWALLRTALVSVQPVCLPDGGFLRARRPMGLSHRDRTPVSSRRLPLLLAAGRGGTRGAPGPRRPQMLGRSRSLPNPRTTGCGVSQLLQPMAFRPARGGVAAGSARRARRGALCSRRHVEPLRYHGLRTGSATSCPSITQDGNRVWVLPGAAECKT